MTFFSKENDGHIRVYFFFGKSNYTTNKTKWKKIDYEKHVQCMWQNVNIYFLQLELIFDSYLKIVLAFNTHEFLP